MGFLMDAINEVTEGKSLEEKVRHMAIASYMTARMAGVDKRKLVVPSCKDAAGNPVDLEKLVDEVLAGEGTPRRAGF